MHGEPPDERPPPGAVRRCTAPGGTQGREKQSPYSSAHFTCPKLRCSSESCWGTVLYTDTPRHVRLAGGLAGRGGGPRTAHRTPEQDGGPLAAHAVVGPGAEAA